MKVFTLIFAVSVCFEIPKQTESVDYILSEQIPKQNRNCQVFRFEPKEKTSVSQDTLVSMYIKKNILYIGIKHQGLTGLSISI